MQVTKKLDRGGGACDFAKTSNSSWILCNFFYRWTKLYLGLDMRSVTPDNSRSHARTSATEIN